MKKRILTMLLALVMVLSLSTVAFADDGINTADELKNAIASGGEIVVTGDITLTEAITISGSVTIKANSAVTITTSATDLFNVGQGGTLTLGENITVNSSVGAILYAHDGGTININGANLTAGENEENTLCYVEAGTVNMTAGSMVSTKKVAIKTVNAGANVNISGGTVSSAGDNAIWATAGTVKISGTAKIVDTGTNANSQGYVTLWAQGGTINVSGGEVESKGYTLSVESNGSSSVTGGSFTGPVKANGGTLAISGGTFNTDVSDYLANGFEMNANGDGTYGVQEKVYPETVSFWGENLELGNTLNMAFIFAKDQRADWTGYTAKVTMNGETTTYSLDQWKTDNTGDYYYIYFTGIYAKEMTDEITVVIYDAAGQAVSETFKTSIKEYGTELMTKEPAKKDMVVALLNYGAEAQKIFNYKVETLANADLT